jgi:hypothetical protein
MASSQSGCRSDYRRPGPVSHCSQKPPRVFSLFDLKCFKTLILRPGICYLIGVRDFHDNRFSTVTE